VEIDDTPKFFDGLDDGRARNWPVVADSARPETISYLQRNGYTLMEPAVKGPGSLKDGVIFLQGYDIVVHPRCKHTIDELTHYSYVVDKKTEAITSELEDKKNHVIDSLRYATEKLRHDGAWVTW
jgi:phage terminase large subunit